MIECGMTAASREVEHIKREIVTRRFNSILSQTG
jgi:hypothetical protein